MTINVSEALDIDTAETATIERATGGYADGLYVSGIPFTLPTLVSVQQPTPEDLQFLPEGERTSDIRLFISTIPVFSAEEATSSVADVITYKGTRFKVISSGNWESYGHTTALGAREA